MDYYCVMTFNSTSHALNFEKLFKGRGIAVRLMPVPRQVSSSCGTAAELPCQLREEIQKLCHQQHIEYDEVHMIHHKQQKNWFVDWIKK